MKHKFLAILFILIFLTVFILAEGENIEEEIQDLLSGLTIQPSEIATLFENPELLSRFNDVIYSNFNLLNGNQILKSAWLMHYGIEFFDNPELENFDGDSVKIVGQNGVTFNLNDIDVKIINEDGSVVLENGVEIKGGSISLEPSNDDIHHYIVRDSIISLDRFDTDELAHFNLINSKVLLNEKIYSLDDNFDLSLLTGLDELSKTSSTGENSFEVSLGEETTFKSDKLLIEKDSNDQIISILKGEISFLEKGDKLLLKGSSFIPFSNNKPLYGISVVDQDLLFTSSACLDGSSCIIARENFPLQVLQEGEGTIKITNLGEVEGLNVIKFGTSGSVYYYNNKGSARFLDDPVMSSQGLLSDLVGVSTLSSSEGFSDVGVLFSEEQTSYWGEKKILSGVLNEDTSKESFISFASSGPNEISLMESEFIDRSALFRGSNTLIKSAPIINNLIFGDWSKELFKS